MIKIKVGDLIHLKSINGVYTIKAIYSAHIRVTTNRLEHTNDSFVVSLEDYKCHYTKGNNSPNNVAVRQMLMLWKAKVILDETIVELSKKKGTKWNKT